MIALKVDMIKSITTRLSVFCDSNKNLSKLNLNDGTVSAEDFFATLFNLLYRDKNSNFFNANVLNSIYPGIDLLDLDNKVAAQVTIDNTLGKVKSTFTKIPKVQENKLYTKVKFVIQDNRITSGMKKFGPKYEGYDVEVVCIPDILREINGLMDDKHIEAICKYVESAIRVPDKIVAEEKVDNDAFEVLFQALKDRVEKEDIIEAEDPIIVYKSSPQEKKEKFKDDWNKLISLYKYALGMSGEVGDYNKLINYEKRLNECFSQDLNEIQKELILKYLRVESYIFLNKNSGKPLVSIDEFTQKIIDDFKVGFLQKTQVMSFVLNMFFMCDVFPLEYQQNEED